MALFKILHGDELNLDFNTTPFHEGWCYITHNGYFYIDLNIGTSANPNNQRIKLNAKDAETLENMSLEEIQEIINSAVADLQDQIDDKSDIGHTHSYAGSSSVGGSATSAEKLTSSAGSTTQPVYFKDGKPVKTTYTLGKSVPSNAVFTDTHYSSKNVVGSSTATSNTTSALTNGNVYLNSVENGAVTSSHKISGSGATTVTSDTSGNIVISSPNTAGTALGLVKSGGDVTISSGVITVNDDSHNHIIGNIDGLQTQLTSINDAISQTLTDAKAYTDDEIEELQIGGRNLLLNTAEAREVTAPSTGDPSINSRYTTYNMVLSPSIDEIYTISADVEVLAGDVSKISVAFYDEGFTTGFETRPDIVDGHIKKVVTIARSNMKKLLLYAGISGSTAGNSVIFSKVKFEKGNKATDWSPAPEDILAEAKKYTNTQKAKYLPLTGGTLTGSLVAPVYKSDTTECAIKVSSGNEVSFGSSTNVLYIGFQNRVGSVSVDTYKFGTHSGMDGSTNGTIECGAIKAKSGIFSGTLSDGTNSIAVANIANKSDVQTQLTSIQDQIDDKSDIGHTHSYAGSSSAGGSATSAEKLTSSAGSTTQPVYFKDGKPVATSYSLNKSVPSNAVFTDTHYSSKNVVGSSTATSNTTSALTNGNVYLNSVENGAVTSSHKISGSGATTVTSDTSGNIVISSTNTTYSAAGTALGLVKSGGDVTISSGVITVNDDSHNHIIGNIDGLQTQLTSIQDQIDDKINAAIYNVLNTPI